VSALAGDRRTGISPSRLTVIKATCSRMRVFTVCYDISR
jgi:hypothetical protein